MILLLVLTSFVASVFGSVVDCGFTPEFTISSLGQSPETYVKPGDNTTLTLKYYVPEVISGGTATTSLSLNGIPFSPSTEDLCTKVQCPITIGEHDGSSWTIFPSGVSGKIVSKVEWKDTNGKQLLCLKSTFQASSSLEGNGEVNVLEGILTAKPVKKSKSKKNLVHYTSLPFDFSNLTVTGSSSGSETSSSTATGSSSGSGSGSITINNERKLRGSK
jgi:hypothetical protein